MSWVSFSPRRTGKGLRRGLKPTLRDACDCASHMTDEPNTLSYARSDGRRRRVTLVLIIAIASFWSVAIVGSYYFEIIFAKSVGDSDYLVTVGDARLTCLFLDGNLASERTFLQFNRQASGLFGDSSIKSFEDLGGPPSFRLPGLEFNRLPYGFIINLWLIAPLSLLSAILSLKVFRKLLRR